jgi:isopenicillin N synthase-like dioxygenase
MKILKINYSDKNAGAQLVESFQNTGFAVIQNHNISKQLILKVYKEWEDFFKRQDKNKFKYNPNKIRQSGYFPFKSENAKDSKIKDLKEFFHIFKNQDIPSSKMKHTKILKKELSKMGIHLLKMIDKNISKKTLKTNQKLSDMMKIKGEYLMRILHYPPITEMESGAVRAAAHEDINLITLLVSATQSGLQVKDVNGKWHNVESDFGNIIVNVGDMLQLATGGYFKSTTHQVVNPDGADALKSRYSLPLFISPENSIKLTKDKTSGEYLKERLLEIGLIKK